MAVLDHIHMGSANNYVSAYNMQKEMGIGHYDGGFMSSITINHKAFPLGGGVYIEVESVIDPFAVTAENEPWFVKKAQQFNTEVFSGLCLRVDTMEELADIAKRLGGIVNLKPAQRIRPDGPGVMSFSAPGGPNIPNPWQSGYPNWYCFQNRMYCHPSGQPPVNAPDLKNPMGVAWLEMGGTPEAMAKWLGQSPDDFGMRFNGKKPGLYAIGIKTDKGIVELRRPSATQDTL
jgi:hypothetical protein